MASLYLDTSALIKLYIEEEGTPVLLRLAEELDGDRMTILDIALVEIRSAVRRRERQGDIPGPDANRILNQFEEDASLLYLVQPSSSAVIEDAVRLIDLYPLRAYDALQLAGALTARLGAPSSLTFVSADSDLCESAGSEGLSVLNPLDAE